jgi:hypothetical protein
MPRNGDSAKLREWSGRVQRFEQSPQTVAEFCRAEGVCQASFYQWKRRLTGGGPRGRQAAPGRGRSAASANSPAGFRPVVVTPPAHGVSVRIQLPGGAAIELKDDPVVIEQVAKQLLDHQPGTGGKAC